MKPSPSRLRVAFLAGTLGQGGAEKQLFYMVSALLREGVDVRLYSLTRNETFERKFTAVGVQPSWVGSDSNPLLRLREIAGRLQAFDPHIVQSAHTYTNIYAGIAGRSLGILSIGALRSSLNHSKDANKHWTPWLLRLPHAVLVNSRSAIAEIRKANITNYGKLFYLGNVIDLSEFQAVEENRGAVSASDPFTVAFIGRLLPVKRVDLFLRALSMVGQEVNFHGLLVGEGPERSNLGNIALDLGLLPHSVTFLGMRKDVPRLMNQIDCLVLCSDSEGFPNVLLEAMAARIPVITTPAGEAPNVVRDRVTGFVIPFNAPQELSRRVIQLARSPNLCRQMGTAGRQRVKRSYDFDGLSSQVLSIYRKVAARKNNRKVLNALH